MTERGARILLVDDDREIIRAIQRSLVALGYVVFTAGSGQEALHMVNNDRPDLIILDLGLPDMNGLEVCKKIRESSALPILVLSVREMERDKVQAFDLGADDYVTKPFGLQELLARIRVALRHAARPAAGAAAVATIGPLAVDFTRRQVRVHGQEVVLTPTEYDLLKVFVQHPGKVLTRHMLLTQVWGTHANMEPHAHSLHVYIGHLRRKIEPDPRRLRFLFTIPGVGYRFAEE
ncbi:DNA-binding response regulator [Ktedonobacter sp. SOSP1-52]|uniref:response regulator transcription factor n=1 Tax=Ktedonobacter sp. SOSP1-52 TaxID=2778366 RepID=UPI0019151A65|nr:response regulator transcription factor [Ktedonobacter sp. SOSP1-52]GHO71606.1 DNA-binding response regulator [Ktedonobacter sp. SOSP1-52]